MTRSHTGNCVAERRSDNCHCRTHSYDVVQLYDIAGAHSDASIARRQTDSPFFGRAVDVNISAERIGVLCFESTQPENARHDWVSPGRIRKHNFAGPPAVFKYGTRWGAIANFFCDLKLA